MRKNGVMASDWRSERERMAQIAERHVVLRHDKWASSYIPATAVPDLVKGKRITPKHQVEMQAKIMHAVTDHAEREASGREQTHGWKLTADKDQQRARLDKTGFQFARVGGRAWTVYGQGSKSYQPYQPCPDEPSLGGPIGGWKEHTDWLPDRTGPASAFYKYLKPGKSQPWFKDVPKPKKKDPKKSVYGNNAGGGGWQPGRSLAPWRARDYVSSRDLDATMSNDLRRTEARLQLTRAGNLYADVLEQTNLPYQPSATSTRPSTAPPRVAARQSDEAAKPTSTFASALKKRLQREALVTKHAEPEPELRSERGSGSEPPPFTSGRPSTAGSSRSRASRPSTASSRHSGSARTLAASPNPSTTTSRADSPRAAAEGTDNVKVLDALASASLAATHMEAAHAALAVVSTVADPAQQQDHGYGDERKVWVGNLDHRIYEEQLKEIFEALGGDEEHDDIVEDVVIREKPAPKKNWCLVTFFNVEHAKLASLVGARGRKWLLETKEIDLPEICEDWKIDMVKPEILKSNAAHLALKVSEAATYQHDKTEKGFVKKLARQPKVRMGPRYERSMGAPRQRQEATQLDEDKQRQLAAAERLGLDPKSSAGRLVRTIAEFGAVEDQKNREMKGALVEHTGLQKTLYTNAVKTHWACSRGGVPGPSSPPSERPDEPTKLQLSPRH